MVSHKQVHFHGLVSVKANGDVVLPVEMEQTLDKRDERVQCRHNALGHAGGRLIPDETCVQRFARLF